jgi:8-oxo-dGTP diphosphatase
MNEVIAKNRSGWILQEYISILEEEISAYPNVTGSYAIVKVGDKYLVGYNGWRKQWEFPAGGIEPGETARQAAYRELLEETHQSNLNLEFKGLFKVTDSHGKQKYQAVFLGEKEALEAFVYSEGDEMSKIHLWDLEEDIGYVDELDVAIIKIIESPSRSGDCALA